MTDRGRAWPTWRARAAAGDRTCQSRGPVQLVAKVVVAALLLLLPGVRIASGAPFAQSPTPTPAASPQASALNRQAFALLSEATGLEVKKDFQGALAKYQQALALFQQAGNQTFERFVRESIGGIYYDLEQYGRALESYQQSLALARDLADRGAEATTLRHAGDVYLRLGQYQKALDLYQEALPILRDLVRQAAAAGDRMKESSLQNEAFLTVFSLGEIYDAQGDYTKSLAIFQEALTTAREQAKLAGQLGDSEQVQFNLLAQSGALNRLGMVYNHAGDYAKALEYYLQKQELDGQLGFVEDKQLLAATDLANIGVTYDNLGQTEQALVYYLQALSLARQGGGSRSQVATILSNIGTAYNGLQQFDRAVESLQQSLDLRRQVGDRAGEGVTLNNLAYAYNGLGQPDLALDLFQQSLAIDRELGDRGNEGIVLANLGQVYEQRGNLEQALAAYQQSIAVQEDVRASAGVAELKSSVAAEAAAAYRHAALLLVRLGRPAEAFDLAERARARTFLDQLGNARLDPAKRGSAQLVQQEQDLRGEIGALDQQLRQERSKPASQQNTELIASLLPQLSASQSAYGDLITQLELSDPESAALETISKPG